MKKYTKDHIRLWAQHYNGNMLSVLLYDGYHDYLAVQYISNEALKESLDKAGYINGYNAFMVRVPTPALVPDMEEYLWLSFDEFMKYNLDDELALNVVLNYLNSTHYK